MRTYRNHRAMTHVNFSQTREHITVTTINKQAKSDGYVDGSQPRLPSAPQIVIFPSQTFHLIRGSLHRGKTIPK